MDTHLIEHIIKIAEEKSITKAAEKLYLTQSALNQQLLKLERELGIPLFRRAKTEMIPTRAGEIYLKGAREILRTKSRTYAEISDLTGSYKGTLSIGMTPVRTCSSTSIRAFTKNIPSWPSSLMNSIFTACSPSLPVETSILAL